MISLDQIRLLEERVLGVVARLSELREENQTLRETLATYQSKIDDLEARVKGYSDSQAEIEKGILNALQQLDELEDEVTETAVSAPDKTDEAEEPEVEATASGTVSEDAAADQPDEAVPDENSDDVVVETDDDVKTGAELDIF